MPTLSMQQLSFLADCDRRLPALLRRTGRYLAATAGVSPDFGKAGSVDAAPTALNSAFTYMDRFVQDVLILDILDRYPGVQFLVEEETTVLRLRRAGPFIATVLIDPIDGTRAFVEGGTDYATLVAVLIEGTLVRCWGLYPAADRLLVADGRRDPALPRLADVAAETGLADPGPDHLCAHYRLVQPAYAPFAAALTELGLSLSWNGNGFMTNLSAAVQVLDGQADAFLCPYTAAHDALAPMGLIAAAGGVVRRYALAPTWSAAERLSFAFSDIEVSPMIDQGRGSPRVRLIGARSAAVLDRIEAILATATEAIPA